MAAPHVVAGLERGADPCRDGFLPYIEVARRADFACLDQFRDPFLEQAHPDHRPVQVAERGAAERRYWRCSRSRSASGLVRSTIAPSVCTRMTRSIQNER